MFKNLKKAALVAAFATLVPAATFASEARVQSLGLQSDYLQDYVNVYFYPSSIVRYQNLVYGDLGIKGSSGGDLADFEDNGDHPPALENSARGMGAYLSTWKFLPGVWGIQINENNNSLSPSYGASYYDRNRNQGIVLLWGQQFNSLALGATIEKASSSGDDGNIHVAPFPPTGPDVPLPTTFSNARALMNAINQGMAEADRNSWGIGAGATFGWDSNGRRQQAEVGVRWRDNSFEVSDAAAGTSLTDNGNTSLAINARAQIAMSDNSYLVPVLNWYDMDRGTEFTDAANPGNNISYDNSVSGFNVGLSEQWVLRESDLLILGVAFNRQEVSADDPTVAGGAAFSATYSQTPSLFGALEVHPAGWLHLRFGAGKPIWSKLEVDDETAGTTLEIQDSPLQYALGAGFRIGSRVDLDAVINQDFSFTGGWAGSGLSEQPVSQLSATYRF